MRKPRKSKRKLHADQSLRCAREAKRSCADEGETSRRAVEGDSTVHSSSASRREPECLEELLEHSDETLDAEDDPSFDLEYTVSILALPSLCANIHPALDSVPLESIQKHFRKVKHYMFAYLEGVGTGSDLEATVKKYKKTILAHRRISEKQ